MLITGFCLRSFVGGDGDKSYGLGRGFSSGFRELGLIGLVL